MRTKTLFSLLVLCGSSAALANLPARQDNPLQNDMTNQGVPAPADTTPPDTMSNATDVEPSAEPTEPTTEPTTPEPTTPDPTTDGTETPPNATY